jgi:hypothetical protein
MIYETAESKPKRGRAGKHCSNFVKMRELGNTVGILYGF